MVSSWQKVFLLLAFADLSSALSTCNETCAAESRRIPRFTNGTQFVIVSTSHNGTRVALPSPSSIPSPPPVVPQRPSRSSILFHGMHASDSHIGSMLPTMKSMARGLDVEVHLLETHTRQKKYSLDSSLNHTFISVKGSLHSHVDSLQRRGLFCIRLGPWRAGTEATGDYKEEFRPIVEKEWDLMVVDDLFTVTGYSLALRNHERYGRPYILISTTLPTVYWCSLMSLGHNALHRPSLYAPKDFSTSRFSHRLEAIAQAALNGGGMKFINEWLLTRGPSLLGVTDYSISRLVQQSSYYFLDDINYFAYPSPVGHDVVHVGLSCPSLPAALPAEYESFVSSNNSKGVIYIAFGSNVPWRFAPAHHMKVFVDGLNQFRDYKVIFSFNGHRHQLEGLGDHVLVTSWAPQKEILYDSRTILYITHGGLKSMKESVCSESPVLFMPLFAEQSHNAHMAKREGFGDIIDKKALSVPDFVDKVSRFLSQPSYKQSIIRFKSLMLDRPISAEDSVAYHTRRALTKSSSLARFKRRGQFLDIIHHLQLIPISVIASLCYFLSQ